MRKLIVLLAVLSVLMVGTAAVAQTNPAPDVSDITVTGGNQIVVTGTITDNYAVDEVYVAIRDRETRNWFTGENWQPAFTRQAVFDHPGWTRNESEQVDVSFAVPTGSYAVGVQAYDFKDNMSETWFVVDVEGTPPPPPPDDCDIDGIGTALYGDITIKYPTCGVLPADGSYPLVVAGHGAQGDGASAARLHAFLVEHGYVVAGFDFEFAGFEQMPSQVSATIDAVNVSSPVDLTDEVGYIGTSFGGMVGLALYEQATADPRIEAIVSKIAYPRTDGPFNDNPPLLMINGDADHVIPIDQAYQFWQGRNTTKAFITLHGVGHDLRGGGQVLTTAPLAWFNTFLQNNSQLDILVEATQQQQNATLAENFG